MRSTKITVYFIILLHWELFIENGEKLRLKELKRKGRKVLREGRKIRKNYI